MTKRNRRAQAQAQHTTAAAPPPAPISTAPAQSFAFDLGDPEPVIGGRSALLEYAAARPSAVVYGYDAQGRLSTATATVGGVDRVTTYTYDAQGRVATVSYPVAGGLVRTETFNYDAQGRASGATAVETNP